MFVVIKWLAEKLKGAGDKSLTDLYDKLDSIKTTGIPRARKFSTIDATSTTTVLAGAVETILITPPAGKVYQLLQARLKVAAPTGASSGSHKIEIRSIDQESTHIDIVSDYTGDIFFRSSHIVSATKYYLPSDDAALLHALTLVYSTNSLPIAIWYVNATDVDQTNKREVMLAVEVFTELGD
jgi:hypothetical protein